MKPQDNKIFARLTDTQALALTEFLEGRDLKYGEDEREKVMIGIAWVVMNRVAHPSWMGNTIKEVIFKPAQFSEYLATDKEYALALKIAGNFDGYRLDEARDRLPEMERRALQLAFEIAAGVLMGHIPTPFVTKSVLNFWARTSHPKYEKDYTMVQTWAGTGFWVKKEARKRSYI